MKSNSVTKNTEKVTTSIPAKLPKIGDFNPKKYLISLGFIFLDQNKVSGLLQYVELPAGWQVENYWLYDFDHGTLDHILDEKGRLRANVYISDSNRANVAELMFLNRFTIEPDFDHLEEFDRCIVRVLDAGKRVYTTKSYPSSSYLPDELAFFRAIEQAKVWLRQHYPNYENFTAYWNDPD
jgi:hypothetical protein